MKGFLGFLFFCIWASFARYYYVCEIKNYCGIDEAPIEILERPKTLFLSQQDSMALEGYEQFSFANGSLDPDFTGSNKAFLREILLIMSKDTSLHLKITGFYRPSESDIRQGYFSDLGEARAHRIRKYISADGVNESRIDVESEAFDSETLLEPLTFHLFKKEALN